LSSLKRLLGLDTVPPQERKGGMGSNLNIFYVSLVGIVALFLQIQDAYAEKRVALVVGNAQYEDVSRLRNPVSDASDLADTLKSLGYDVILTLNAKKNDFDRALADFSRRAEGADVALFYYAGHGVQYQQNNYLLPIDIQVQDIRDVKFQAVSNSVVVSALEEARGVKVLILDACRDNPFSSAKVATRSTGYVSRGLARIDVATKGMVVVYATAPEAVAQDGVGRNSPFAEALINRLKEPGLEISDLFRKVAGDVYRNTDQNQTPEISGNLIGEFFLNPNENDRKAWERIRESQDPDDFHKFIKRFPTSPYTRDAQIRIDLYNQIATARRHEAEREASEQRAREEKRRREEEARIAAQKEEERRRAEEQRQHEAAAEKARAAGEAARLAREDAQRRREEQTRIATQKEEERRRAEEKRQREAAAEKARAAEEAARLVQEDAQRRREKEAERVAAEKLKAAQEAERRSREEAEKVAAAKCNGEKTELRRLTEVGDLQALEKFRAWATCDGMGSAADREVRLLKVAQQRACERDRRTLTLAARKGLIEVRAALSAFTCEAVRSDAEKLVAALEAGEREDQAICVANHNAFNKIDLSSLDALEKLKDLRDQLKCPAAKAEVEVAVGRTEARAKQLQHGLARIGCYSGPFNGQVDRATRNSVAQFLNRKGLPASEGRLTDDFLDILKNQELQICSHTSPLANLPPEAITPSVPESPATKKDHQKHEPSHRQKSVRPASDDALGPPRARQQPARIQRDSVPSVIRSQPEHLRIEHANHRREPARRTFEHAPHAPPGPYAGGGYSNRSHGAADSEHGVGF
jgi:peptidoglycan hydrolase-like protein with peptidoglycan-binding domain